MGLTGQLLTLLIGANATSNKLSLGGETVICLIKL